MGSPAPAPVSLCLIVKNEPKLREHLTPLRPWVKQVCVLDTGSSVEHLKTLRALETEGIIDTLRIGAQGEFDFHGVPIDFARARNASFDLAVEPWILWMDGDDEIDGIEKIGAIIAEHEGYRPYNPGAEFEIKFPYEYSYDAQGRCELVVERERLFSNRRAWHWCWVVHESVCAAPGQGAARFTRTDVVWKHRRQQTGKDGAQSTTRNWALFEKYWEHLDKDAPVDPRMAFYTAMTLRELGRREEAAKYFRLALEHYTIDEDIVVTALRYVGLLLEEGKHREAMVYAFIALRAKEDWGQGWLAVAQVYAEMAKKDNWQHRRTLERLVNFGTIALTLPFSNWFGDPRDRLQVMIAMSIALDHMSRYEEALSLCEKGLKEYPNDAALTGNRDLMLAVVEERRSVEVAERLQAIRARGGAHRRVVDRVASRIAGVYQLTQPAAPASPVEDLLPLRADGTLRILFACGASWQPWNPKIVESPEYRGGGSEVAVVEISKRLAALGHEVMVATDCGTPGVYDGVTWVPSDYLGVAQKTDVLVAWRMASHVNFPVTARLRVLWCHDILAHGANEENLARFDKVVVLSNYHRDQVRGHHPSLGLEKFEVLRSGADARRFGNQLRPRHPGKAVWTSSPDRGLVHLLEIWPAVRKVVPNAELHIFYGWDMWQRMGTDPMGLMHVQHLVRSLKDHGVVYRERVSSDDLATELLTAGVWAYPCTFPEIFCVAGVEAQMAGLRCVASPAGALRETILAGSGAGVEGDPGSLPARESYLRLVVEAMTEPDGATGSKWLPRHTIAHNAQVAFDLGPLGALWEQRLRSWLADKIVMPIFESALAAAE